MLSFWILKCCIAGWRYRSTMCVLGRRFMFRLVSSHFSMFSLLKVAVSMLSFVLSM